MPGEDTKIPQLKPRYFWCKFDNHFEKFVEVVRRLSINISLLDALQVPTYSRYFKDILANKYFVRRLEIYWFKNYYWIVWFYCCILACTELSAMWHPHQHHVIATWHPRHRHVIATSAPCGSHISNQLISTSDVASQSMTITFVTNFGLRAGFNGLYTNLWRLENIIDHANLWRKR
jgi:hypothetical protein